MSSRKNKNDIGKLMDANGNVLNDINDVDREAINYGTKLFNTNEHDDNFPCINTKFLLNENCQDILLTPVRKEEMKNIIFNANNDKSPGPNGLRAKFYKTHWAKININLFDVISEFF